MFRSNRLRVFEAISALVFACACKDAMNEDGTSDEPAVGGAAGAIYQLTGGYSFGSGGYGATPPATGGSVAPGGTPGSGSGSGAGGMGGNGPVGSGGAGAATGGAAGSAGPIGTGGVAGSAGSIGTGAGSRNPTRNGRSPSATIRICRTATTATRAATTASSAS